MATSSTLTEKQLDVINAELNSNKSLTHAAQTIQDAALEVFGDDELNFSEYDFVDLSTLAINKESLSRTLQFRQLMENASSEKKNMINPSREALYSNVFSRVVSMIKSNMD